MGLDELIYAIRGAIFEVNRVLGLLVNFTDPKAETKRFML